MTGIFVFITNKTFEHNSFLSVAIWSVCLRVNSNCAKFITPPFVHRDTKFLRLLFIYRYGIYLPYDPFELFASSSCCSITKYAQCTPALLNVALQ